MFSTTELSIYYCTPVEPEGANNASGPYCRIVSFAELGCRHHLTISLPSAAIPALSVPAVHDLLDFDEVAVKMKQRLQKINSKDLSRFKEILYCSFVRGSHLSL